MFRFQDRITALLQPRTIAVVGVSATRIAQGNDVIANLRRFGFTGEILPVHPTAKVIEDLPAVNSVAELPRDIDVAAVCVPARSVPTVLRDLDAIGCRSAVVVAGGFSSDVTTELGELSKELRLAMQGPNCMGFINVTDATPIYTTPQPLLPPGPVAIVAQSGSAAVGLSHSPGLGFSKIITSGNQTMLTAADYVAWLAEDPNTRTVGIVAESILNPEEFEEAIGRLFDSGKNCVLLKPGRSAAGAKAARAHTGALLRPYAAYEAFLARLGVPVVHDYDEMVSSLQCLSESRLPSPSGSRTAIVGISGGQGAVLADLAEDVGVPLASLSADTTAALASLLPGVTPEVPLDYGGSVNWDPKVWAEALERVLDDEGVDVVVVLQDAQSTLPVEETPLYADHLSAIVNASHASTKPILVVSSTSADSHPAIEKVLHEVGIPLLRGPREALVAVRSIGVRGSADRHSRPQEHLRSVSPDVLVSLRERVRNSPAGPLPQDLVADMLRSYGIQVVHSEMACDAAEAAILAGAIGYPCVAKVISRDVPHRSDVGGVAVGIESEQELRDAIAVIEREVRLHVPHAVIDGYEIQELVTDCVEAVVGFKAAAPFGALVVVGLGGTLVELLGDRASALTPVGEAVAQEMIRGTRLGAILGGYRSLTPRTTLAGLVSVVVRLGEIAQDFGDLVAEADLNPVLVAKGAGEVVVVDALFVRDED